MHDYAEPCCCFDASQYTGTPDADPVIDADSEMMMRKYLGKYGFPPVVVRLPEVGETLPEADFSPLFQQVLP